MKRTFIFVLFCLLISTFAFSQVKFAANQKVEVEWKGRWFKATILEVNENTYKVHYDGYASSWDETVTAARIRGLNNDRTTTTGTKKALKHGKYKCTASTYTGGSYNYIPKGSFEIKPNGTYAYNGFTKPSTGTFVVDRSGTITFKGGYFNGGEATPIEGTENRFYLVFPTIPDGRWTCGLAD